MLDRVGWERRKTQSIAQLYRVFGDVDDGGDSGVVETLLLTLFNKC